ncbi:hypothetical protein BH10BAC1_BH10BAC1_07310 [soil metagenome]
MKNLFLFLSLLLLVCCKTQYDVVRKIDKEHRNTPPGTVWIKDSIYMDQTEIRNLDYLEYLSWIERNDAVNYLKIYPDTLVWRDSLSCNEEYVDYYLKHPAYRDYPVVGVTYEQAVAFCKWRTLRVKEYMRLIGKKEIVPDAKDFYYRLPTKAEWEYAASADVKSKYGFEKLREKDNSPCVNVKETISLGYIKTVDILVSWREFKPNKFHLYNTIGNVAEMITEKGVSKGGSWMNSIEDCEITDSIKYDKPSAWLGFRCVCVVTK